MMLLKMEQSYDKVRAVTSSDDMTAMPGCAQAPDRPGFASSARRAPLQAKIES